MLLTVMTTTMSTTAKTMIMLMKMMLMMPTVITMQMMMIKPLGFLVLCEGKKEKPTTKNKNKNSCTSFMFRNHHLLKMN